VNAPARDTTSAAIAHAALAYAARGWSVIPMLPRGKRPLVVWREFQQRAATPGEIEQWFKRWPDANVGIVTGAVSAIVVVDVDLQHGGPASVAAAEAVRGPLPATVEAATGGGGRHLYYAHPGTTVANRVAVRPGIDVRGDGGCVVAPPSVHPSGRRYAWAAGRGPHERALAPLPVHFFAHAGAARPVGHSRPHWRRLVREGIGKGERNSTIASLTGHLLWRGVDLDVVLELMLAWNRTHCRPPLPDDEVMQVVQSIARVHERDASEPS
jgi:hypothetical protein